MKLISALIALFASSTMVSAEGICAGSDVPEERAQDERAVQSWDTLFISPLGAVVSDGSSLQLDRGS